MGSKKAKYRPPLGNNQQFAPGKFKGRFRDEAVASEHVLTSNIQRNIPMPNQLPQGDKSMQNVAETCAEMNRFMNQSFAAFLRSAEAMSRGWEEVARNASSIMQRQMTHAFSTGKTIMEANSLEEVNSAQSEFMKNSFDCAREGHDKITEVSARTTKEAVEPAVNHVNETVNRISQKARQQNAA